MENNSTWRNSPLSPINWPPDSFRAIASVTVAIGGVVITIAGVFAGSLVLRATGLITVSAKPLSPSAPEMVGPLLILQVLFYLVIGAYLIVMVPGLARRSWSELGLRRPSGRDIAAGLLGALAMFAVVMAAAFVVQTLSGKEQEQTAVKILSSLHDPRYVALFAVSAVVFAPFIEEIAFRGFLFNAFLRYTGPITAATLSGLLFGIAHGEVFAMIPLALGGVVLALTYYRTGCLWSSMIAHGTFNGVEVLGVLFTHVAHAAK